MGFADWWRRRHPAPLVNTPADPVELQCARLVVRTVEDMVVVATTHGALVQLTAALGAGTDPVRLSCPGVRDASFVPSRDERQTPALDPNRGWLIPLTGAAREHVVEALTRGLGAARVADEAEEAWEFPEAHLGIVVNE